jgi:hypothetical protein
VASRDIYEAVAAIAHRLPDPESFAAVNAHLGPDQLDLALIDAQYQVQQDRDAMIEQMRERVAVAAEHDREIDPLLDLLAEYRGRMLNLERQMRLLIAYAREFVRPQPYQLKELALAAGLSISGVRIAYDEDEIREVSEVTGAKPRRPQPPAA